MKQEITGRDIRLCCQSQEKRGYRGVPSYNEMADLAKSVNSRPLPLQSGVAGVTLPPANFCLFGDHIVTDDSLLSSTATTVNSEKTTAAADGTVTTGASFVSNSNSIHSALPFRIEQKKRQRPPSAFETDNNSKRKHV